MMMKKTLSVLIVFIATTLSAQAGVQISGGGGDGFVIEFTQLARQIFESLDFLQPAIAQWDQMDISKMKRALEKSQIQSTSKVLTLNGKTVSAINYHDEQKIIFNQTDWKSMPKESRVQLILHEILGLTYGPELDRDYRSSAKLLERFKQAEMESAVLAVARANVWGGEKFRILPQRTKILRDFDPKNEEASQLLEICIQTFENGSSKSVRIYHVELSPLGPIRKIEWTDSEGPVGP